MTQIRQRISWVLLLVSFGLFAVAWFNHQAITDWFRLYGYQPTAAVSQLAADDQMTDKAKHLYYINRPEVVAKAGFEQKCTIHEQTIVLGCYHADQNGIFILKIADDQRLEGVMQVTAAHEMLHAAYDRLSDSERRQVNSWLQAFYDDGLADKRVTATVDLYKKTEPHDVLNEMHSIFATEVKTLPAQLDNYYKQYFADRQAVVSQTASYRSEFTKREAAVAAYDRRLAGKKAEIDQHRSQLSSQAAQIEARQQQLEKFRNSGQIEAYNAQVASYNTLVRTYNALIGTTKSEITAYNKLVAERNAIALETRQLNQELQGNLSTIN